MSLLVLSPLIFGIVLDGLLLSAQPTSGTSSNPYDDRQVYMPGEIVVKVNPDIKPGDIADLNNSHGSEVIEKVDSLGFYRLKVSKSVAEAALSYQADPAVEYAKPNYIFAVIGEESITLLDMELRLHRMIPPLRQRYAEMEAKEKLLRSFVNKKLFFRAAKDEDLLSQPEVQKEIDAAIEKVLAGIFLQRIQDSLVTHTENDLMAYYEKNKNQYKTPEQIRGRRIILKNKKEADKVKELLEGGADFGELARDRSIDPSSAQKDGMFDWVSQGEIGRPFDEVVFATPKGGMTDVISTQYGHYIIKVEDHRGPGQLTFLEVKDQVVQSLTEETRKKRLDSKTRELEEKYGVRLYSEFLAEIKIPEHKLDQQDTVQMLREFIERAVEDPF
jgi:hypothetical protein